MVYSACPKCGFPLGEKYAVILNALKEKRKGGWSVSDLTRALKVVHPLVFERVRYLEKDGAVTTRVERGRSGKRRIVELVKKIRKPKGLT